MFGEFSQHITKYKMATTKTLQGVIRITEVGDYYLALPDNGARAQNSLAIKNVEDVIITIGQ